MIGRGRLLWWNIDAEASRKKGDSTIAGSSLPVVEAEFHKERRGGKPWVHSTRFTKIVAASPEYMIGIEPARRLITSFVCDLRIIRTKFLRYGQQLYLPRITRFDVQEARKIDAYPCRT